MEISEVETPEVETPEVETLAQDEQVGADGHISFPDIGQFRNTIRKVVDRAKYDGIPVPILKFHGSVKLHGTNSGIVFFPDGRIQVQSRSRVITPEDDNLGFAAYVRDNPAFAALGRSVRISTGNVVNPIAVYGEWCGGNIQKGVAINDLPKMFVVFAIRVYRQPEPSIWLGPAEIRTALADLPIKSVYDFRTFDVEIDFSRPELVQNQLGDLTSEVERVCPIGEAFGKEGTGEGIVWNPYATAAFPTHGLAFKVKGEKHSESKVKTLAPVDVEKINSIRLLVATIVTEHRLEKKLDTLREQGLQFEVKNTGQFLKIVGQDVNKEEADTIETSGLDRKSVMAEVAKVARQWWMTQLDKQVGLS